MLNPSLSTIDRISQQCGCGNFESTTAECRLMVAKLTLKAIFDILGKDLQLLPQKFLEELKGDMLRIINGFYFLLANQAVRDVDLNVVMPTLFKVHSHLLRASTILEEDKVKNNEYYEQLNFCRWEIFNALAYFPP